MTRMLRLGLILLVPMAFLSACADKCPPARPMMLPAVLMQEIPEPKFKGKTNGDLLTWSLELREALRLANADKAALREWARSSLCDVSERMRGGI